jgi:hypothetical protein
MDGRNRLYDTIQMSRRQQTKRRTNQVYGQSILEKATKITDRSRRLKGTTTAWTYVAEPETYDNPWDAVVWREWQGRAEEFWDARLQGRIFWELEKNESTR